MAGQCGKRKCKIIFFRDPGGGPLKPADEGGRRLFRARPDCRWHGLAGEWGDELAGRKVESDSGNGWRDCPRSPARGQVSA